MKRLSKKVLSIAICLLFVATLSSSAGIHMIKADTQENENQTDEMRDAVEKENSFTEEGTTTMGTISQMPEFALNTALMYVEEVYVEAGSAVAEGDPLFRIAAECMEEAKAYYEEAIVAASDSLTEAKVAYESGELDASYVKLDAETKAANAEITLETALAELDETIEEKYEAWQEAAYKISAYNDNFYNNIYYTNSGIEEKETTVITAQEAFDAACTAYEAAGTTYETAKTDFETAVVELIGAIEGNSVSGMTVEEASSKVAECYRTFQEVEPLYEAYESADKNLQQAKQALEQAKVSYERTVEQAEKSLEQLEGSVDALKENYETANREAETKRLELQQEYESAVLEGEYAQNTYNQTVEQLKAAVENAEDTLAELKEEQAALLALEDGVVCANQTGTIASVSYDVEDVLFSGTALVTYYDTSTLTISVEVAQENIAKVTVGDEVEVSISGNRRGSITGTVTSVASSATAGGSASEVTYAVVISIENENNRLSAGTSATVTFEYGE